MPTAVRVSNAAAAKAASVSGDANDRVIVYATIATNEKLILSAPPRYSFTLPAGFAVPGVAYYLALSTGTTWLGGYGSQTFAIAGPTATTVDADGRYGLTIPANGALSVALYARNSAAATPVPAPLPTASPAPTAMPTPSGTATPTARPTPTPTPTPAATPTPLVTPAPAPHPTATPTPLVTPTPTPHPTATPTPLMMTVSSTTLSFTSGAAQHVTVTETGYSGALIQTNTCPGIATVTPADAGGPSAIFTVTPVNGGSCSIHFTGSSGVTANVSVGVTTISIPVQ
jgi:hypothetical protein